METESRRFFQYLAGPRQGEIVVFDKIEEEDGLVFIAFKDGSRCEESLIIPINQKNYSNELLAEIENPNNVWVFTEEWIGREEEKWDTNSSGEQVCVIPFRPGRKKVTPIPPKTTISKFGQISTFTSTPPPNNDNIDSNIKNQQQALDKAQQSNSSDPVYIMCEKAKKFDTEISMTLNISLPKRSFYNVAKESFEDGGEKVIEYIIQNLDDQAIKASLKQALLESYEDSDTIINDSQI
jgi:hypothetical protein